MESWAASNRTQPGCGKTFYDSELKVGSIVHIMLMPAVHLMCGRFATFLFQRLGQPRVVFQMITGMLVGMAAEQISPYNSDYLIRNIGTMANLGFAFLIGLELDTSHLYNIRRTPLVILGANMAAGVVLATPIYYYLTKPLMVDMDLKHNSLLFITLLVLLGNTSSPIIVRTCADIKVANTEIGRTAVYSALFNDVGCLFLVALINYNDRFLTHLLSISIFTPPLIAGAVYILRFLALFFNRRHPNRKTIKLSETFIIISIITTFSNVCGQLGFEPMICALIFGLYFPREGKTIRTVISVMGKFIHKLLLPIYFSVIGSQVYFELRDDEFRWVAYSVSGCAIVGKVASTVAAAMYLKMRFVEGLTLGFMFNVKSYATLVAIKTALAGKVINKKLYDLMLTTMVMCTILTGPIVSYIVGRQRRALAFDHFGLERAPPDSQLSLLACVYGPRHMPAALNIIEMSRGADRAPFTAYLMQLIELTEQTGSTLLYNQRPDEEEEEDFGGEDTRLVNAAADAYIRESGMALYELKAVSVFNNMHEDVCHATEDVRASVLLLPFHKHRRYDGIMEVTNEGYRLTNRKVQARARCTVALIVDRGIGTANALNGSHQHLVALFFGGPDDREALTYAARLADHPAVSLTVVRFLPATQKEYEAGVAMETSKDDQVLKSIEKFEVENHADREFLYKYGQRYVNTGLVTYMEKYVENSAETITALSLMDGMYSLYIVGKGAHGLSPLTAGMSDWAECPELGPTGDLLASSDFMNTGSVLVVQQYRGPNKDPDEGDDFQPL